MRKLHVLAGLVLLTAIAWSVYDWIVADEGVRYFSQDQRRILLLLAIVGVGAPLLLGYETLSVTWKRRVALWLVGFLAAGATAFAIHVACTMGRLAGFLVETHQLWMALVGALFPVAVAGCLWWAFSRIRHRRAV
jgi:hypothetical protein